MYNEARKGCEHAVFFKSYTNFTSPELAQTLHGSIDAAGTVNCTFLEMNDGIYERWRNRMTISGSNRRHTDFVCWQV
jgi:hypothetical protein